MKLLLDLDATVFDTYHEIDVLHKAVFQKDLNWEALKDKDNNYWKTEQGIWVMNIFENDLFYAELNAYKGSREVLQIFMRNPKNEIIYCTARVQKLEEATAYSIGRNGLPYGDIILVDRDDCHINKLEIAVIESIDVAVDDEARTLFALKDQCLTICYTQDYNLKYPFGYRANDWNDVNKVLKVIGGK